MSRLTALTALAWAILTPLAVAQHPLEVAPTVGVYIPTGKMFDEFDSSCGCHSTIAQQSGLVYGVHLGFGAASRVTLEMTADMGISRVRVAEPSQPVASIPGTVFIFGARLRVNARRGAVTTPYLSAGVAYLAHSSDFYAGSDFNDVGALSLGVGLRVVAGRHLAGRIDVEDYHYGVQVGSTAPRQLDNDLVLSVGLGLMP
ncbi:MAG TPA: hypothetical protein VI159_08235 [Gemmatimonadales bacterium]